jgi:site-specific DNA-methyltransferase (adenine-specific)
MTIDEIEARIIGDIPIGRAPKVKPWVDLMNGDCLLMLKELDANSVDAVVTDPPYGLEFMGKDWDGANGFRRSLNAADAGRDNAFGRTSAKAPEYRTTGKGVKSKPGIGDRPTEWVSNQGWNQYRCATCGHLFHGGSPCHCENPHPVKADNRWNLFQQWCEAWAIECLRVLKPGGHLLAFGGSRTYHRLASAVEDAGFEIRDQIMWLYGSGFPKSSNQDGDWDGWGTALKPAHEPIVVARKPLIGTMAKNLAVHGVGALNIDGCRVGDFVNTTPPGTDRYNAANFKQGYRPSAYGRDDEASADRRYTERGSTNFAATPGPRGGSPAGRWPANIIHDGSDEVIGAFPIAPGQLAKASNSSDARKTQNVYGAMKRGSDGAEPRDTGGSAARFFYCAKASKADRDEGMTTPPKPVVTFATANGTSGKPSSISEGRNTEYRNTHPTVKPTNLMRYLTRLVTPPNGVVLDPFMGSGSTGRGAILEGFNFIGIEMSPEYFDIADARIAAAEKAFME